MKKHPGSKSSTSTLSNPKAFNHPGIQSKKSKRAEHAHQCLQLGKRASQVGCECASEHITWGNGDTGEDILVPVCTGTCECEHVTVSRRVDTNCSVGTGGEAHTEAGHVQGGKCLQAHLTPMDEFEKFSHLPHSPTL